MPRDDSRRNPGERPSNANASAQVEIDDPALLTALAGPRNDHLKTLETESGVAIGMRGNQIHLQGAAEDVAFVERVIAELVLSIRDGSALTAPDVARAIRMLREHPEVRLKDVFHDVVLVSARHRVIAPKGLAQKKYIEAIRDHDVVFGIGPAGTGKCIAGDSLVLSDRGLLPIEEIAAASTTQGDYAPIDLRVAGLEGIEVASHAYNGGESAVRRIRTRFGFEIAATPEHPLLQLLPTGEMAWRRADELEPGDFVAIQRGQCLFGSETRVDFHDDERSVMSHPRPVVLEELDEEVAYMLGMLTGDECLTFKNRVILSTADAEVVERFEAFAKRFGLHVFRNGGDRPYDYIIASAALYRLLMHLGMSAGRAHEKRVPRAILRAPQPMVAAFLRGLFDADGTVDKRSGYPGLCSASSRLITEVQLMLLNFGILAARRQHRARVRNERRAYHELEMRGAEAQLFFDAIGFALARKQSRRQMRVANTNINVVPYLSRSIQLAISAAVPMARADHKRLDDYRSGRRQPSYEKLDEILGILTAAASTGAFARMAQIAERRLFWAEITDITPDRAHVYDLTVPGTHSFCANGFVNHNTYLAMAMAVAALTSRQIKRIILTRPAVEAGEKLGFLPGDLAEKVNPYLRPLYDAMHDMMDMDKAQALIQRGQIEVAPLAFMRGRAQPYFSRVLTPTGWRPIGSLKVGDSVIGSDGRPTKVLGAYPQGPREVFRVTAQDGATTLCCGEHLWTVFTPEDRRDNKPGRTLETREMIGKLRRAHQHRYELPLLSEPVRFAPRDVPMDPYALGLLLGDGCITAKTTPAFATADLELVHALEMEMPGIELRAKGGVDYVLRHVNGGRGGRIVANPVTVTLRDLGLVGPRSTTKFVPEQYLYNSPGVRLALLQGLLDTDGGPVTQRGRSCRVQYTTTSPRLRDDVQFLVRSLGGVAYSRTREAAGRRPGRARGRDVGYNADAFVMDIRLPVGMMPFRLRRKWDTFVMAGEGGRPMRYIDSIEPAGVQDTLCIRVAAPDSLYVTDDFLLTHNTLNDSFVILDEAQNTTPEQMKMFLTRLGFDSKAVITGDVTQVDLPEGRKSGLSDAIHLLANVEGIKFCTFTDVDVVRHPLVAKIVRAYEARDSAIERGRAMRVERDDDDQS